MAENVYDASFITYANCSLDQPTLERREFLGSLIQGISQIITGNDRLRWNKHLWQEYHDHVSECRNDVIDQFFEILTSENAVQGKNSLRRQDDDRAHQCNWPKHDRHLIAAAIGGAKVTIHVTEERLGRCAPDVKRKFQIKVNYVPPVLPDEEKDH